MKRITSLRIEKLFGTFDYDIDFDKNDGFTILTAPNGFGKSTILKIIRAAASGNICYFAGLVFDRIEMSFKGALGDEWRPRIGPGSEPLPDEEASKPKETVFVIEKVPRMVEIPPEAEEEVTPGSDMEEDSMPYTCYVRCDDSEAVFTDEDIDRVTNDVVAAIPSLEPMLPFMSAGGSCRLWKDKRDGEVYDLSGVYQRYGLQFRKMFAWITPMVRRLNFMVNYISTNRLYDEENDRTVSPLGRPIRSRSLSENQEGRSAHLLKIFSISSDIRMAYNRYMREQLQTARNLESNFVDRVVERLNNKERPSSEELRKKINTKITGIRKLENSCNEFGITSANRMNRDLQTDDDSALVVFDMYLDDVREKLVVFNPLLKRLKVFTDSLKALLDLKTVSINLSQWDNILEVKNSISNASIPLDALSSGEQHLIVLLGRLLFDASNSDALVMMDEPEISFHPSWQEKFSDILFKIQNESKETKNSKTVKRHFIIATHSPAFIGDHWDKTVELAKMVK